MGLGVSQRAISFMFALYFGLVTLDASSNFLLISRPLALPVIREFLLVALALLVVKWPRGASNQVLLYLYLLIAVSSSVFLGPKITFHLVRLLLMLAVAHYFLCNYRGLIYSTVVTGIVYFFALYHFNSAGLHVDQGTRFFAANASVVSVAALFLTTANHRPYSVFGYMAGCLSGSMAFIAYALARLSREPQVVLALVVIYGIIRPWVVETSSHDRLERVFKTLFELDLVGTIAETTLSIRFDQLRSVVQGDSFSFLGGASLKVAPGAAGIESQVLHLFAYGGVGGFLLVSAGLIVLHLLVIGKRVRFMSVAIVVLYGLTFRWLESAFASLLLSFCVVSFSMQKSNRLKKS